MSDYSISIVPRQLSYPDNKIKAKEILDWLISLDIVKPTLSDCILSSDNGYAISDGARRVASMPDEIRFDRITNGLEIITNRNVFNNGVYDIDECICPNCKKNIVLEDWGSSNDWYEQKSDSITCPLCNVATDIPQFKFSPELGFSDLGFTFWNWPELTDEFIEEFRQKLGCDILLLLTYI